MRTTISIIPMILAACTFGAACGGTSAERADSIAPAQAVGTTGTHDPSAGRADRVPADRDEVVTTSLFRNIVKRENPVVVSITTQSRVSTPELGQFGGDDFFRRFFEAPRGPREQIQSTLGSGFIISPDGEILTNNHVVAGAQQIRVGLFSDQRKTYAANVIGRDLLTDSALIKLQNGPDKLPTAELGDSDALEPGDWVVAIGNPFRLGHTVTVGVVSYKARPFAVSEGRFENICRPMLRSIQATRVVH